MNEGTLPFEVKTEEEPKKHSPKVQKVLKDVKEKLPIEKIPRRPNSEKTPLIYRGGKSSLATWIINYFPPHKVFIDVFGGGAAISLAKSPSGVDVYNDIGDVSRFFEVLRNYGDEVYQFLTFYPFSREAFYYAFKQKKVMEATVFPSWDIAEYEVVNAPYKVRWAAYYYITILQSFRHEEEDNTWVMSKGVNLANSFASHVDAFPEIIDRLRNVVIEHKDFLELIEQYDSSDTLFYCDPPYLPDTWTSGKSYKHEMTREQHASFLETIIKIKGQCVISGYPSTMYNMFLSKENGFYTVEKTRLQGIKNSNQDGSNRTEVLWIKEHNVGIWSSFDVSGVSVL